MASPAYGVFDRKQQVSIREARVAQDVGHHCENPNYRRVGHPDRDLPTLFRAMFIITWRPQSLPEKEQHAILERA